METQTPPTIDLLKFCSTDLTRPNISQPFNDDEWTYATDARLIVRVPKIGDYKAFNLPEKLREAWKGWPDSAIEWFPLSELPPQPEGSPCPVDSFDGDHTECWECDGDGKIKDWPRVEIGHRTFNSMFLHKIASLPSPLVGRDYGTEPEAMPFKFDGGCGLLMPIRVAPKTIK